MYKQRIKQVMSQTFRIAVEEIPDDVTPGVLTKWDSFGHIELMLRLEMEFGVHFATDDIPQLVSLDLIEQYLEPQGTGA